MSAGSSLEWQNGQLFQKGGTGAGGPEPRGHQSFLAMLPWSHGLFVTDSTIANPRLLQKGN